MCVGYTQLDQTALDELNSKPKETQTYNHFVPFTRVFDRIPAQKWNLK